MRRPNFTGKVREGLRLLLDDSSLLNNTDRTAAQRTALRRAQAYIEDMNTWHTTRSKETTDDRHTQEA